MKEITIEDVLKKHRVFTAGKEALERVTAAMTEYASLNRQGCRWVKASEKDFDSNIGDKHWRANGKAVSAGMAFVLFKKKTGDDIEVLEESIEPCATSSENYWKQRCEAAEGVLHFCPLLFLSMSENVRFDKAYESWKAVKSQTP